MSEFVEQHATGLEVHVRSVVAGKGTFHMVRAVADAHMAVATVLGRNAVVAPQDVVEGMEHGNAVVGGEVERLHHLVRHLADVFFRLCHHGVVYGRPLGVGRFVGETDFFEMSAPCSGGVACACGHRIGFGSLVQSAFAVRLVAHLEVEGAAFGQCGV